MRLLVTTDTIGGVWSFTSHLTAQLLARGHAVHLVSFGRQPDADQVAATESFAAAYPHSFGFTASDVPLEWMQNNEFALSPGEALLQPLLAGPIPPDLILSNQFCFGKLSSPVPRVVVAHSDVLSWARAVKPSALEPTPWLNRYTSMVQAGLLDAAAVVTPTAWMGRALGNSFFLPRSLVVIPNGTAVEPAAGAAPARTLQAITAGRLWDEAKGLQTLRGVQLPMPLLLAGEGDVPSDLFAAGSTGEVKVLGPLPAAELHARFRASALYLCPSLYEPFGLAPLEAAQCGCAVVARDLPSLREVWGDNAVYFTDAASLSATLQLLAADPDRLSELQQRGKAHADRFTTERMTDSYLQLFESLLARNRTGLHAA